MDSVRITLRTIKTFLVLFVVTLLFSFSSNFIYFINSTFLQNHIGTGNVAYVYAIGAILNLIAYLLVPKILRRIGNYRLVSVLTVLIFLVLIGLAFVNQTWEIVALFIGYMMLSPILVYNTDIFLQRYSSAEEMGSIRGIYLTMSNVPAIITPFIVGLILTKPDYWKLYLISAAFLVPCFILITSTFKRFDDPYYPKMHVREVIQKFYHSRNVFDIFVDNILLQLFYVWLAIYMPLYLQNQMGFSWSQIGIMFSIMLIPFLLLQIPVGRIADEFWDEKYLLIFGFSVMTITVLLVPFIHTVSFVLWTLLLFISRIGASIVEVANESYFFKHVHASNTSFISFYRITRSLPYIIIPLVSLLLLTMDLRYTFVVLGLIMTLGIRYAISIKPDGLPGHEKEGLPPTFFETRDRI